MADWRLNLPQQQYRGREKSGLGELAELITGMYVGGRREAREERRQSDKALFNEYNKSLDYLYDNTQLLDEKARVESYLSDNRANMDDGMIEQYEYLIEKYDAQKKKNNDFVVGRAQAIKYGSDIENILTDYSDANLKTTFTIDTGTETMEYTPTEDELIAYRDDYKRKQKDLMSSKLQDYAKFSSDFTTLHGERLSSGAFRRDAVMLENLNEIYNFGILQATDDGLFDEQEKQAYQQALAGKSLQPIEDYINKEAEFSRRIVARETGEIEDLYDSGKDVQNLLNKRSEYFEMSPEDKLGIGEQTIKVEDEKYQYKDFDDDESDLNTLFDTMFSNLEKTKQQIRQKDSVLSRRLGQSYLNEINNSDNEVWNASFPAISQLTTRGIGGTGGTGGTGTGGTGTPVVEEEEKPSKLRWVAPAALGAKMLAPEKASAALTYAKDALVNASKNLNQSFGMSVDQMETFWKSNEAADIFEELDKWDERLKGTSKGSSKWHEIRNQRDSYIKRVSKGFSKNPTFKDFKWSPTRWEQLMKAKGKINFFKFKRSLKNVLSVDMFNKIFGKGSGIAKTAIKGVGTRVVPFSIGQTLAEQAGLGKYGQVTTGVATAATIPVAFKWVAEKAAPKLTRILGSDYGKKKLIQFLTKKISKKMAVNIVAAGTGVGVLAGIGGTIWAAHDVYKFIKDYKE